MQFKKENNQKNQLSFFFLGETIVYGCYFVLSFILMVWGAYLNQYAAYSQSELPYTVVHRIVGIVYTIALLVVFLLACFRQRKKGDKSANSILGVWAIGYLASFILLWVVSLILQQLAVGGRSPLNGADSLLIGDLVLPLCIVCILIVSYLISKERLFLLLGAANIILYPILYLLLKTFPQTAYTLDALWTHSNSFLTTLKSLVPFADLLILGIAFKNKKQVV